MGVSLALPLQLGGSDSDLAARLNFRCETPLPHSVAWMAGSPSRPHPPRGCRSLCEAGREKTRAGRDSPVRRAGSVIPASESCRDLIGPGPVERPGVCESEILVKANPVRFEMCVRGSAASRRESGLSAGRRPASQACHDRLGPAQR
jgi:hypothetical protein